MNIRSMCRGDKAGGEECEEPYQDRRGREDELSSDREEYCCEPRNGDPEFEREGRHDIQTIA